MVTRHDYRKNEADACLSVLIELMTTLGEIREHIVLVGGWIPFFLLKVSQYEHVGSLDIDIALDFHKISEDTYDTILQALKCQSFSYVLSGVTRTGVWQISHEKLCQSFSYVLSGVTCDTETPCASNCKCQSFSYVLSGEIAVSVNKKIQLSLFPISELVRNDSYH